MTLPAEIKTKRLLLRRFTFEDVDDVYEYASSENWSKFLPVPTPYHKSDAEFFIAQHIIKPQDKYNQWAMEFERKVIGGINFNFVVDSYEIAEFHWSISETYWGKGLMTEAAIAIRNIAFTQVKSLNRIQSRCDVENIGSWRVMEKIGMQREGTHRQSFKVRESWADMFHYGLLRSEWEAIVS